MQHGCIVVLYLHFRRCKNNFQIESWEVDKCLALDGGSLFVRSFARNIIKKWNKINWMKTICVHYRLQPSKVCNVHDTQMCRSILFNRKRKRKIYILFRNRLKRIHMHSTANEWHSQCNWHVSPGTFDCCERAPYKRAQPEIMDVYRPSFVPYIWFFFYHHHNAD